MSNKNQKPDFKELNDRVIQETPSGPFFSIKTNLDADNALEENPYADHAKDKKEKQQIQNFFKENRCE
jgi:hypothetical protein